MSDAEELLQWNRAQNKADLLFVKAMLFNLSGIGLFLLADLVATPYGMVWLTWLGACIAFAGSLFGLILWQSMKTSGYTRTVLGYFIPHPYPPLDEWSQSLEERGVFTDFGEESGIYVTASDMQITDGGVELTKNGKDKLEEERNE